MSNDNRDGGGRYATWWMGLCSFAALLVLMFFVVTSIMGSGN